MSNEKLFESSLTHIKCPSGAPGIKKRRRKLILFFVPFIHFNKLYCIFLMHLCLRQNAKWFDPFNKKPRNKFAH